MFALIGQRTRSPVPASTEASGGGRRIALRRILPACHVFIYVALLVLGMEQLRQQEAMREADLLRPSTPFVSHKVGWGDEWPPRPWAVRLRWALNAPAVLVAIPLTPLVFIFPIDDLVEKFGYVPYEVSDDLILGLAGIVFWYLFGTWLDRKRGLLPASERPAGGLVHLALGSVFLSWVLGFWHLFFP